MSFSIPEGFDLAAYIADVLAEGTVLARSDANPNPCGSVTIEGLKMSVRLHAPTEAKWALVVGKAILRGAMPL